MKNNRNCKNRISDSLWCVSISWIFRLITGAVFTFSGFVKAVDPWGTFYKFEDYIGAMSLSVPDTLILAGVFFLCGLEFLAGVSILTGSFRRLSIWVAALIMIIMLPLTFWLAVWNPVTDCGCFGDAIILSNWATFWKNVALSIMIGWLILFNRSIHWIITPALQWIGLIAGLIYYIYVASTGYWSQPLIDFRPYKTGTPIVSETEYKEPEFIFIYERNGERKEVTVDEELPDENDGWKFVDRIEKQSSMAVSADEEKSLRFFDIESDSDATDEIPFSAGQRLTVLIPDISRVSILSAWPLNALYHKAEKENIEMIVALSANIEQINQWTDLFMPDYPIYIAEDTSMKEAARGNPAVIFTDDGIIKWKTSLQRLSDEGLMDEGSDLRIANAVNPESRSLQSWSVGYVMILSILIIFSFIPVGFNFLAGFRRKTKSEEIIHDGKANLKE